MEAVDKVDQLKVYIDGVQQGAGNYTVSGGSIAFNNTPGSGAIVTASYRYYWKVHIPASKIKMEHVFMDFKKSNTLNLESWR